MWERLRNTHSSVAYSTPSRALPWATRPDHFRLVQADDCLRQGIVIGITKKSTLPTEASTPAAANRSVYRIERYWLPRSPVSSKL